MVLSVGGGALVWVRHGVGLGGMIGVGLGWQVVVDVAAAL